MAVKVAFIGHSQVKHLKKSVKGHFIRNNIEFHCKVFSYPGAKTDYFVNREWKIVSEYRPDICVLFLGSNDIDSAANTENISFLDKVVKNLKEIKSDLECIASVRKVFFVTVEPRERVRHVAARRYNSGRNYINRKLKVAYGDLIFNGWKLGDLVDGVHGNKQAFHILSRNIVQEIKKYLDRC